MRANALPIPEPVEPLVEPKVRPFSVRARWLREGDGRLDAAFYADEAVAARRTVEDSGFDLKPLGDPDVARKLFWPSRFKRIYTSDPQEGYPFLQAAEALMFRPPMGRWLARSKAPNADDYFARPGWILVTRSGAVGRCVLVGRRLARFFLSEDLIRVVPALPAGYLYAYLSSWIGQALMAREQYGMTVAHLEPQHLARLPVPLLPEDEQQAIHEQIMQAYRLRDEANDLLDRADELLHAELGLPRFDESQASYLQPPASEPPPNPYRPLKAFAVRASELAGRLDASFHIPVAKTVVEQLRKGRYPLARLGDVAARIFIPPRFKRIYVAAEHGVPFLQPSHVPLIKPYDLKFISRRANAAHIEEYALREQWVIVTRSGAVGRVLYVPKPLDGWVGSDDLIRIVANQDRLQPGYLAAFLMTPYGYHQLARGIHGGVVDHLEEEHVAAVWLPDAPPDVQARIGTLVVEAFEKKEEANRLENEAIARLEKTLEGGKRRRYAIMGNPEAKGPAV